MLLAYSVYTQAAMKKDMVKQRNLMIARAIKGMCKLVAKECITEAQQLEHEE